MADITVRIRRLLFNGLICKDGERTFWDMQQNQEIHKDVDWQDKMLEIEMRVSDMDGYKDIAFFHHLMIEKR